MASRIAFTGPSRPERASLIGTNSPRLRCMAYSPMFLRQDRDTHQRLRWSPFSFGRPTLGLELQSSGRFVETLGVGYPLHSGTPYGLWPRGSGTRVLPRLVLKYTLRAAHLELGGAEQEVRRGGKP